MLSGDFGAVELMATAISVSLSTELLFRIETIQEETGRSRSAIIRDLLEAGLADGGDVVSTLKEELEDARRRLEDLKPSQSSDPGKPTIVNARSPGVRVK